MMAGMYAAISGLDANQAMLNDTANNLANVNTVGYKASSVTFADSLTQVIRGASGPTSSNGGSNPVQIGLGVAVNATRNEMTEGAFQTTGNPLDVAIEGSGFLRVGAGEPPAKEPYTAGVPTALMYTRAGDLTTNTQGFLTTQAGMYVIGRNAVPKEGELETTYSAGTEDTYIRIPPGATNISIGMDGSVGYTDNDAESKTFGQRVVAGYLSLATFANESGLERRRRLAVGDDGQLRRTDRGHALDPGLRGDGGRRARDVERRSRHRDDQDDHRRARLPGQLAGDHDGRHDARNAGVDALGRRRSDLVGKGGTGTRHSEEAWFGTAATVAVPARG